MKSHPIRRIALLPLFLALVWVPVLAQDEQSARNAVAHKHFAEARTIYEQLFEREPQNTEYQIWIARLSGWLNDYGRAIDTYDGVLRREPRNIEALTGKAYVLMWQHKFAAASELLTQAEKLAPNDPEVLLALARWSHYQGQDRPAAERVERALSLDPDNEDARALRGELEVPQTVELHVGFTEDRFSFTNPGNMGFLSAGFNGQSNHVTLQYEEWNRFDERTRRAGLNFTRKWKNGWWLRAGAVLGPGAVVIPRQEYTAGTSHSLPHHFVFDADYRLLRFRLADVHLASPALSYYFAKPIWITATYYNGWTEWRASTAAARVNHSWLGQYYEQIAKLVTLHAGYARGSESFELLSIDRLGIFEANTYLGGVEYRFSRSYSTEFFCTYQTRSNHSHQTSFGVNFTAKR